MPGVCLHHKVRSLSCPNDALTCGQHFESCIYSESRVVRSFVYYASRGHAPVNLWGQAPDAETLYYLKFSAMYSPNGWSTVLNACNPRCRSALTALRQVLLGDSIHQALTEEVTVEEFVQAIRTQTQVQDQYHDMQHQDPPANMATM